MAVYVDELMNFGWRLRGKPVQNCHMFTDEMDLAALHAAAQAIGMKRSWFQDKTAAPHYDLTRGRRDAAVAAGVIPLSRADAVAVWKARRTAVAAACEAPCGQCGAKTVQGRNCGSQDVEFMKNCVCAEGVGP